MKPSIGSSVHYVSFGSPVREDGTQEYTSQCRAAVITSVIPDSYDEDCTLFVMNPDGLFFNKECSHDEETKRGGTWHWPERVTEDE